MQQVFEFFLSFIVYINSFFKVDNCKNYVLENIINDLINDLATFNFYTKI